MGLFDKVKNAVKNAQNAVSNATNTGNTQEASTPPSHVPHGSVDEPVENYEDNNDNDNDEGGFDLAGFNPNTDEENFYRAVLHMESEGQFGGTDESRAEIMARYGIRDRSHWHTVKESYYSILAQRFGGNEVSQREMNWR